MHPSREAKVVWPADHLCTTEGCGHRKDQHAEPIREDGHCTVIGCPCFGWDPMTEAQWERVMRGDEPGDP